MASAVTLNTGAYMTIFYDVDGTLAAAFEAPPPLMRRLLSSLEAAGVRQVLCSGKNHECLAGLARGLGLMRSTVVIAENGAIVFDWRSLEVTNLAGEAPYRARLREALREVLRPEWFYEEPKVSALTFLPVRGAEEVSSSVLIEGLTVETMYHWHRGGRVLLPVEVTMTNPRLIRQGIAVSSVEDVPGGRLLRRPMRSRRRDAAGT